jgi:hypothetical protein
MGEVIEEVGGNGFMFSVPNVNRRTMAEITDGLVPGLQLRSLTHSAYAHQHLRDNLLEFKARLPAIQATRHRVWKARSSDVVGISVTSPGCRDMDKSEEHQSTRRTAA